MKLTQILKTLKPAPTVQAHCDGPCGVYDPAQARVAAEAVLSMTKKLAVMEKPTCKEVEEVRQYMNTMSRYVAIKEQEAHATREHLLVLWTDFFKPEHLEKFPELHDIFWKAAKLCSSTKHHVDVEKAEELLKTVEKIHHMFWEAKGKDVPWVTASI